MSPAARRDLHLPGTASGTHSARDHWTPTYAELKGLLNPRNECAPARLSDLNSQSRWVLDRGATEPTLLLHISSA